MKLINKSIEPILLTQYKAAKANATWDECKFDSARREQIQKQLFADQGGICAYCEIDLKPADSTGLADFRVEHFHPKSDKSTAHNWHIDWINLLACCHGGSQANVVDANLRFTSPDNSCDVPKSSQILDHLILNPLHLPSTPKLFVCSRVDGKLSVNTIGCDIAAVDKTKAQNTINYLNLNANRINRMRKAELDELNKLMRHLLLAGYQLSDAREKLARALLQKNSSGCWPKFFTSIRGYLGEAAEAQLKSIGFVG